MVIKVFFPVEASTVDNEKWLGLIQSKLLHVVPAPLSVGNAVAEFAKIGVDVERCSDEGVVLKAISFGYVLNANIIGTIGKGAIVHALDSPSRVDWEEHDVASVRDKEFSDFRG